MRILELDRLLVEGIAASVPERAADSLADCRRLFADEARARAVVESTGIRARRLAGPGVTSLDLCCEAAERLLAGVASRDGVAAEEVRRSVGAVLCVTVTPARQMPANACAAQHRLGLPEDLLAYDVGQACAGYLHGLHAAGLLARATGRRVLLLDGDVQSAITDPDDAATAPVLADAGTATLVGAPAEGADAARFAFLTRGDLGEALTLERGGRVRMDGFGVYRFVATEARRLVRGFLDATGLGADDFAAFVPHQANVYMIRQLARAVGFPAEKLRVSADELGNPGSSSVPLTVSRTCAPGERLLAAGFGGGLAASVAEFALPADAVLLPGA